MTYLEVINNCKLLIESSFNELALRILNNHPFPNLNHSISSYSLYNEFQLVDANLAFFIPELRDREDDGIALSIGLCQIRKEKNGFFHYTSKIRYDNNGDLILGDSVFLTADITTSSGRYVFAIDDIEISTIEVTSFDDALTKAVESVFEIFNLKVELIGLKLNEIKDS